MNIDENKKLVIALDGPSGAGKGLIGRLLADKLNLRYFQSSILYRVLAYEIIAAKVDLDNIETIISLSENIITKDFENKDLENEIIGAIASKAAIIAKVRENINKHLRKVVDDNQKLVMEGRDIGTQVIPDADLKIFLTASLETRAKRRYKQLIERGKDVILAEISEQLKERDIRDAARAIAPLVPAIDAKIVDTSELNPSEIITQILKFL